MPPLPSDLLLQKISTLEKRLDLVLSNQRHGHLQTPMRSPAAAACVLSAQRRRLFGRDGTPSPYQRTPCCRSVRREQRHPDAVAAATDDDGAQQDAPRTGGVVSGVGGAVAAGMRCMTMTTTVCKGVAMARAYRRNGPSAAAIDAVVQLRGLLGQWHGAAAAQLAPALAQLQCWGPACLALASSAASSAGSTAVAAREAVSLVARWLRVRIEPRWRGWRQQPWLQRLQRLWRLLLRRRRTALLVLCTVAVLWARAVLLRRRRRQQGYQRRGARWVTYGPHDLSIAVTAASASDGAVVAASAERTAFALSILAMPFPIALSSPRAVVDQAWQQQPTPTAPLPPLPRQAPRCWPRTPAPALAEATTKRAQGARRREPLADHTANLVNGCIRPSAHQSD